MTTDKKRYQVTFTKQIADDFERLAKDSGLTKSGILTVLIRNEIERREKEQKK